MLTIDFVWCVGNLSSFQYIGEIWILEKEYVFHKDMLPCFMTASKGSYLQLTLG